MGAVGYMTRSGLMNCRQVWRASLRDKKIHLHRCDKMLPHKRPHRCLCGAVKW